MTAVTVIAVVKWTWLLGAVALGGYLLARHRAHGRITLVAGWVVVGAALAIGAGLIHLPNLEKLIEDAGTALGRWTYLLVGVLAFLETGAFIGLVAPGETAVLVGGLVAGQGRISLAVLIAIVWVAAVLGDVTSFTIGRRLGREWLLLHGARLKITEDKLETVEGFFERHGGATIVIGRFIGFVRPLAPFVAGASRFPLRRFVPYDVLGAGLWSATFCVLGYVFWRSFDKLTTYVSRGLFAFGTVIAFGAAIYGLVRLRNDERLRARGRAWLAEREDSRLWRPVVLAAGPTWRWFGRPTAAGAEGFGRFAMNRLTPGAGLGLELTTMLAGLAVGAFAFMLIGEAVRAGGIGGLTGADDAAANLASDLRTDWLVDTAKVVTNLGSSPVTGLLVAVTAIWAAIKRRWIDAGALVAGWLLSVLAVHLTKAAYDRPRPAGSLIDTALSSFPSGHSAYAVSLVACAVVLVRAGTGWAVRFAAVAVAAGLVVVVAATRVYLGAHYLTDVLGGIALGVAVWCAVGVAALVVGRVRHNVAER
jgi:membrane protein DedA with SNARE-associated domain/membrane-associated phospholipid phosphatase